MSDTNAQQSVTLAVNAAGFLSATMPVSKRENGKAVKIGDVAFFVPALAAFGIDAKVESVSEEDGLPVYADPKADWLFSAVVAAVKQKVRSILDGATFTEGNSAPADFEALLAEGKRGGAGQWLALVAKLKKAFAAYVAGLGKSAAVQAKLVEMFSNPKGLSMAANETKAKFRPYLEGFVEACEDTDLLEAGAKYLTQIEDALAETALEDF